VARFSRARALVAFPPQGGLPEDVCRLIDAHIPTMEHLEVFLLLLRASPEARTPTQVAMELRVDAGATATRLDHLHASGLLEVSADNGERAYRWTPHSPAEAHAVEDLKDLYHARPVSLIRYVYERPRGAAQQFADAFRLRKERE